MQFLADRSSVTVELMVRFVVCFHCPSSSVTNVVWLSVRSQEKSFYTSNWPCVLNPSTQNISNLVQEKHFKI